ncbi:MAG: nucleoside monophosphate kinase [Verrucomicrobia bacterium]|nr:nucleoside monophosphate kinase [Verrucomicrobiota bacterium]
MSTQTALRPQAILLLGPTGSGKTPLGEWLEQHGLSKSRCHHFDFGANLRAVASGAMTESFRPDEVRFIREVLEKGALLENETFHLAAKILRAFIARRKPQPDDLLILNGLPRHSGQAEALEPFLYVVAVVSLECSPAIIRERIRLNAGGDRAARTDDHDALLEKKLAIFSARTRALISCYRERGVRVITIAVDVGTQPAEIVAASLRDEIVY